MFKPLPCLALCLLLATGFVSAQDAASARQAARELAGAAKTGDMMWLVEKMYPQLRANLAHNLPGGMKQLNDQYRAMGQALKQQGVRISEFEVQEPYSECVVKAGREKLVVLPTRCVFEGKDPSSGRNFKLEKISFLYALTEVGSKNWTFIDGSTLTLNDLRSLITDVPLTIALPPVSQRVLP
jgi:hypothetical protein